MVYKSKFGFHPCDKETFLKLKEINKDYLEALRMQAVWDRWHRKEPQNRVMRKKLRNSQGQVVGYMAPVPIKEPSISHVFNGFVYGELPDLYREARYPKESACPLFEEGTIKKINELYDKVVKHRKVA